jgi:hypothetical protein
MSQLSDDLLAQAKHLATLDATRPKQANLRRAVSSAYYALFHFLVEESCNQITGKTRSPARQLMSRAFEHGKMKEVCMEFKKQTPTDILKPHWITLSLPCSDLTQVAESFIYLQELRHSADYDLSTPVNRQAATDAYDLACEAVSIWRSLSSAQPELVSFFANTLLLWPLVKGRR